MDTRVDIARLIEGDVVTDPETLKKFSRDTSIFERTPELVVFPKNAADVSAIVRAVHDAKEKGERVSVTARAAGTDMTGGPLTDSILLVFTKYMNRMLETGPDYAIAEPGMYYRDFEKTTRAQSGAILPPYPASRELVALGGMIANDAGGELTLRYGKMHDYVQELDVILSDGSQATLKSLTDAELESKKKEATLEGEIYRRMDALVRGHKEEIERARPNVTKNSAGYALWDICDRRGRFDLARLIVGSQGTLALITRARLRIERPSEHRALLVVFLSDLETLPEIVKRVRSFNPESFESYDDHTWRIAVRYGWQFLKRVGFGDMVRLAFAFLPEVWMTLTGGVPKLVLMAEFAEDSIEKAQETARRAYDKVRELGVPCRLAFGKMEAEKYWKIRRESFALLRHAYHGLKAVPFIDDIIVHPDDYPKFLPELRALLSEYNVIYTIAGHIGDANFHIIPLENLAVPEHRRVIRELTPKVYALVAKYNGSITAEHNDGIIRTPYLSLMFSPAMIDLFAETKRIFDPLNILNPGKKTGGTLEDIERSMMRHA